MKERIVIEEPKFIEYFKHTDNDYYEHRVEQVPENWEDLKKIALSFPKRKNGIYVILKHFLDNNQEYLSIRRMNYEICQITHNRIRFFSLAMAIDIQHSWMIIKGIMEEK